MALDPFGLEPFQFVFPLNFVKMHGKVRTRLRAKREQFKNNHLAEM